MLSSDLAEIYQTQVKQINQAVKRNPDRFPDPEFCFYLTAAEWENLKSQKVTPSHGGVRYAPLVFTRMGANMLSAVLKTAVAAERSVQVMRAFSALEEKAQRLTKELPPPPPPTTTTLSRADLEALLGEFSNLKSKSKEESEALKAEVLDLLRYKVAVLESTTKTKQRASKKSKRASTTPVTPAEVSTIHTLHAQGLTPSEISRKVGRSVTTVKYILRAKQYVRESTPDGNLDRLNSALSDLFGKEVHFQLHSRLAEILDEGQRE